MRGAGKAGMGWACAVLLAWAGQAMAATADATAAAAACPAPVHVDPVYPHDLLRSQQGGTVVLLLEVDACGRVAAATVRQASGQPALDAAAQEAAMQWVLDARARSRVVDGRVEVPLGFSMQRQKAQAFHAPDWPASHRRARFQAQALDGYDSVQDLLDRHDLRPDGMITPPFEHIHNVFFRQRDAVPAEYWLFVFQQGKARTAARYRLETDAGEPVVQVAILCDGAPRTCDEDRRALMRGFRFARPR